MPYIGNEPADRFTSIPTVQQFNGDGSTTAFTLSRTVSSDQDILVSVDGVIQDTAAYAVSSGTTLTFSAAPSTGTANIFVNHLGLTIGSVVHPASSALVATTGTFNDALSAKGGAVFNEDSADVDFRVESNGNANMLFVDGGNDRVGLGTAAPAATLDVGGGLIADPTIRIDSASGGDPTLIFDGSAANRSGLIKFYDNGSTTGGFISYLHNGDVMNFGAGTTGTASLTIGDGYVSMPTQPAFSVHKNNTDQNNLGTGDVTVTWAAERFDVGSNFGAAGFTAPVTGKYQLQVSLRFNDLDADHVYMMVVISTSNENYRFIIDPDFGQNAAFFTISGTILADMDASDTAKIIVNRDGGASTSDIEGDAEYTHFSGFLAC